MSNYFFFFLASTAWLSTCIPPPAVTTERRCVFLASPENTEWTQREGNISGLSQHCARTNCCMGYFRLESGEPTPVLLGNNNAFRSATPPLPPVRFCSPLESRCNHQKLARTSCSFHTMGQKDA